MPKNALLCLAGGGQGGRRNLVLRHSIVAAPFLHTHRQPRPAPHLGLAGLRGWSQTLPGCFSCESCMVHRRRPLGTDPGSAFVYFARGREMCRTLPFWDGGPWSPAEVVSVVRSLSSDRVPAAEHHDCQRNPWHRRNSPHHWAVRTGDHDRDHSDQAQASINGDATVRVETGLGQTPGLPSSGERCCR